MITTAVQAKINQAQEQINRLNHVIEIVRLKCAHGKTNRKWAALLCEAPLAEITKLEAQIRHL